MQFGERLQAAVSVVGECQADGPALLGVGFSSHQAGGFGAIDESDGAVVA